MKYSKKDHTFAICAYGESPYLEECIASLRNQTLPSEILLCTAAPSGYLCGIAERYGIPLKVRGGEPKIADDWNFAIASARTPLVTLAHQDDIYEPEFLEKTLEALNRKTHPLIAFTGYYEIRGSKRRYAKDSRMLRIKELMLLPLKANVLADSRFCRRIILSFGSPICCPSVTYVKGHLPKHIFKRGFSAALDWQAWERLSRLKGAFCYVPRPLMGHRIHENSTTSKVIGDSRSRSAEDLSMLECFWPERIAKLINYFYAKAQDENTDRGS